MEETLIETRIESKRWFAAWNEFRADPAQPWFAQLLHRYWAAARSLWNAPPDETGFPASVADLLHRACDAIMTRPPVSSDPEEGLSRLAEVCERMIAAHHPDVKTSAGVMSWSRYGDTISKLERYRRDLNEGAIGGLYSLAVRLYLHPEYAPHGIGEVVRWLDDRNAFIQQAIDDAVMAMEREREEEERRLIEEERKRVSLYAEKLLPRYAKKRLAFSSRPAEDGWTNGHLADFVKVPKWVTLDGDPVCAQRLMSQAQFAQTKIDPVAIYAANEPCVAFKAPDVGGIRFVFADGLYWKYFLKEHGEIEAWIDPFDPCAPIFIRKDGKPIGVIAQFRVDVPLPAFESLIEMARAAN